MKRKEVLKYLPEAKKLASDAKAKMKLGTSLVKEATEAKVIADALQGVTLFEDFPIKTLQLSGGIEIRSGCDEVRRSAYVKPGHTTPGFIVTTYQNEGSDVDGTPIQGEFKKAEALRLAKEFVAKGVKQGPNKRGRPRKVSVG